MTKFINKVNAFGDSAGDSMSTNKTKWKGLPSVGFPKGGMKKYPGGAGDISGGNRRLAKSKVGTGGATHSVRGQNAFTKGKGK